MPSIGHLAVGLAAGRVTRPQSGPRAALWTGLLVAASFAPDLDVVAFRLGIPYGAPFGHRGAAHSIVVGFALGVVVGLAGSRLGVRLPLAIATAALVAVSHGALDALTDGGRGIALFWPFSTERVFSGWRPIPVAPLGLGVLSRRGMDVALRELLLFAPLLVVAVWPSRRRTVG